MYRAPDALKQTPSGRGDGCEESEEGMEG